MSTEQSFRAGLLNPQVPAPEGLRGAGTAPAGKRYDVYRNNVTHSLIAAMRTAFPLVQKLLGGARFDALATGFVRKHPPSSPLLMRYGAEFPEFIARSEEVSDIGYLPDAARLDLALRISYHAADATALDAETLAAIPETALGDARFAVPPATHILRSDWPLFDIWRFSFEPDAAAPRDIAQDVLITRPTFDPLPHLLPVGAAEWFAALETGTPFGAAHEKAVVACPNFDLAATLRLALETGALTHFQDKAPA